MEEQNHIVLSIGSNQGDRKKVIQKAIYMINREVATVISVSKLYESPSWGFESDAFYNCAIFSTYFKISFKSVAKSTKN